MDKDGVDRAVDSGGDSGLKERCVQRVSAILWTQHVSSLKALREHCDCTGPHMTQVLIQEGDVQVKECIVCSEAGQNRVNRQTIKGKDIMNLSLPES